MNIHESEKRAEKLDLTIFIDAFGWRILNENPFMEDILVNKKPLNTVFGYSSTCIPTILTGKMPKEHEHFSFFYYNPELSPFGVMKYLQYLPKEITRRGRIRRYMSRFIKEYYGFTGYFQIYNMPFEHLPLFNYSEKKDLYAPSGINSGVNTFIDVLSQSGTPFSLSDWTASETQNLQTVTEAIERKQPRVAYVYLADLDGILHEYGTHSNEMKQKIEWYETQLRELYKTATDNYEEVNLTVFSDHGQADIHTVSDVKSSIGKLDVTFGEDYVAVYDSTVARFWGLKEGALEKIKQALEGHPHGHWMTEQELSSLGCLFAGNKYGELFFLMNPGVLLCPSFMGETPLAAMHGYHPDDVDSTAMIASTQPIPESVQRLDDMFQYILNNAKIPKSQWRPTK